MRTEIIRLIFPTEAREAVVSELQSHQHDELVYDEFIEEESQRTFWYATETNGFGDYIIVIQEKLCARGIPFLHESFDRREERFITSGWLFTEKGERVYRTFGERDTYIDAYGLQELFPNMDAVKEAIETAIAEHGIPHFKNQIEYGKRYLTNVLLRVND